jgi:hypothetical protein
MVLLAVQDLSFYGAGRSQMRAGGATWIFEPEEEPPC